MKIRKMMTTLAGLAGLYVLVIRPWHLRWGAHEDEVNRAEPGDELIPTARILSTRAVTIQAPPEAIWPWLVQIGYRRAGWYSYDVLERAIGVGDFVEGASSTSIVPELQDLSVGDAINTDPGGGFTVSRIEPNRLLLLQARIGVDGSHFPLTGPRPANSFDCTWSFHLLPLEDGSTRLVARCRFDYQPAPVTSLFGRVLLEPAVFLMERKMLLGIKARAEQTAAPVA